MACSINNCQDFLSDLCGEQWDISLSAPSNIAIVKYWGKFPNQIPMNPSLSMTLNECRSFIDASITRNLNQNGVQVESFLFEGVPELKFQQKIQQYYETLSLFLPSLNQFSFSLKSHNTFPHSAGIASSASAFAALSGLIVELVRLGGQSLKKEDRAELWSQLARLGSGSASRSVSGPWMAWGLQDPEYAEVISDVDPFWCQLHDKILIVDRGEKAVSSTAGHKLMEKHLFREARKSQAFDHFQSLLKVLKSRDWNKFTEICEAEALSLHAMMMTSSPSFLLLQPESIALIHEIKLLRQKGHQVCFTIDAGPNIHLLYPPSEKDIVEKTFSGFESIDDFCGTGPVIMDKIQ